MIALDYLGFVEDTSVFGGDYVVEELFPFGCAELDVVERFELLPWGVLKMLDSH